MLHGCPDALCLLAPSNTADYEVPSPEDFFNVARTLEACNDNKAILFGRGGLTNGHMGTRYCRYFIVAPRARAYNEIPTNMKERFVLDLIELCWLQGRQFRKKLDDGTWVSLSYDEKKVYNRLQQLLRETAIVLRESGPDAPRKVVEGDHEDDARPKYQFFNKDIKCHGQNLQDNHVGNKYLWNFILPQHAEDFPMAPDAKIKEVLKICENEERAFVTTLGIKLSYKSKYDLVYKALNDVAFLLKKSGPVGDLDPITDATGSLENMDGVDFEGIRKQMAGNNPGNSDQSQAVRGWKDSEVLGKRSAAGGKKTKKKRKASKPRAKHGVEAAPKQCTLKDAPKNAPMLKPPPHDDADIDTKSKMKTASKDLVTYLLSDDIDFGVMDDLFDDIDFGVMGDLF